MNPHSYVYTSSRGRRLEGRINAKSIYVLPGGKLQTLCDIAYDKLKYVDGVKIAYFIVGIPDICCLEKDKKRGYEESILQLDINHFEKFKATVLSVEAIMNTINCKVVFATITTMSFSEWNNARLSQGKTSILKYSEKYPIMQNSLNTVLHSINNFITELNTRNQVLTPFLHSPVHKCRKGNIRYIYSKLVDGLHPGEDLVEMWVARMNDIIVQNESNL